MLHVTVPGVPPSANHRYGRSQEGRWFRNAETESYEHDVTYIVRNAAAQHAGLRSRWKFLTRTGSRIRIQVKWYRESLRRRDSDSILKALSDGVSAGLDIDDQFFEFTTHHAVDTADPRVELTISLEGTSE